MCRPPLPNAFPVKHDAGLLAHDQYAAAFVVADIHTQGLVTFPGLRRTISSHDFVAGASARGVGFLVAAGPRHRFTRAVNAQALLAILKVGIRRSSAASQAQYSNNGQISDHFLRFAREVKGRVIGSTDEKCHRSDIIRMDHLKGYLSERRRAALG